MLDRAIESNYNKILKSLIVDDEADFSDDLTLDCLEKSLNARERKLTSILLTIIFNREVLFSTSLIPNAEKRGSHKIVFRFDYSDFEVAQKINVEVGLMSITSLFDELTQSESQFVLDKEFQIYLSNDLYSFAFKRIEKGRALLMDMCYKNFGGFLEIVLDNHIFTQLTLNISVVANFLKENWYPFLNAGAKVIKSRYLEKVAQMVAKYGWSMPQDFAWDIEKSELFVALLETEYSYEQKVNGKVERVATGMPLSVFFEDFDFRIPAEDQIPACALSLYFFAEIFGTNIGKSPRLDWFNGKNYIEHPLFSNKNEDEMRVCGSRLIDATSFKPTGFCDEICSLDLSNLSHEKLDMNAVEKNLKDESLDFDSFFGQFALTQRTFGGQVMTEIELGLDEKRDEYALVIYDLGE